jgi:glycosyltransferase involved in cell wall biosynthesis
MKSSVSVILITKNEEHDIRDCLISIAWADEIIVLDSGSSDKTLEIARKYTSHVYSNTDWQGFGIQKNRALAYATGEWVLSVDADERVSEELRYEIQYAISTQDAAIYSMPRLSSYCGKYIRHSGWWPDYVVRLFKRGNATFSNDLVHERLVFDGVAKQLISPLMHNTYKDLDEVIAKINQYSTLGAKNSLKKGKHGGLTSAVGHSLWAFIRTYILRAGFLDGAEGFMLAVSNAETTYYRYLKLYYLNKQL